MYRLSKIVKHCSSKNPLRTISTPTNIQNPNSDPEYVHLWNNKDSRIKIKTEADSNNNKDKNALISINDILRKNSIRNIISIDQKAFADDLNCIETKSNADSNLFSTKFIMDLFHKWLSTAKTYEPYLISHSNAVCLSTINTYDSYPCSRFILLKSYAMKSGIFVFFTNYTSNKAQEIEMGNNVCLTFYWHILDAQIRINGSIKERTSEEMSDAYWKSRGRKSQLSAITSQQSQTISCLEDMQSQYDLNVERFANTEEIERPHHWGGYQLKANSIEFWKGNNHRFHDRILFQLQGNGQQLWSAVRLQP